MKHDLYKLADQHHLNANEQLLLQAVLETAKNGGQCSVREFAAQNYTSPAAVIRLSKKMGYTGYTDMIYRIGFLIQNEIDNKNHASDITAFIGGYPRRKNYTALWSCSTPTGKKPILVTGTGFCAPLQEFMVRKLLVLGYCAIGSNSYEVYESGALNAGLVIAISKSGKTGTILKPVQDSFAQHRSIIAFVGADNSPIARCADPAFVLLDDKMLDDRNLTANYFYARVLITFEYLMDLVLEKDEHPNGKGRAVSGFHA